MKVISMLRLIFSEICDYSLRRGATSEDFLVRVLLEPRIFSASSVASVSSLEEVAFQSGLTMFLLLPCGQLSPLCSTLFCPGTCSHVESHPIWGQTAVMPAGSSSNLPQMGPAGSGCNPGSLCPARKMATN